jgi:hypothetical protein
MVTGGFIVSISFVVTAFMPNIILVIVSLGIFGGKLVCNHPLKISIC